MSVGLAFWLLVVGGLLLYVYKARASAPVNPPKRRPGNESSVRRTPARSHDHVPAARKPAAVRTKPSTRRPSASVSAAPAKRARRGGRRGPLAWLIFKDR